MEKNVGETDRIIRVIIGLIALILAIVPFLNLGLTFLVNEWIQLIVFGIIAVIMFFTAYTQFCILYKPFNIRTNK